MTPFTDRRGRLSLLKCATLALLVLPAAVLLLRARAGDLGPLPAKQALLDCGTWAIRFLVLTLALTPAQRIFDWPRLTLIRRMTGIAAFLYGALHVVLYAATLQFDLAKLAAETVSRIYLAIGFVALAGLALLAATSTEAAMRRLGSRWKLLHRAVYGIAALGLLHFALQSKIDASSALLLAGLFALLMGQRLALRLMRPVTPASLAAVAIAAAIVTAAAEGLWYGTTTSLDPWRVVAANLRLDLGVRPAVAVLSVGLAVAGLAALRAVRPGARAGLRPSPG